MKKFGNILWGCLFVIVGVIFGSNALGITDIDIFFDGWWTLFIIIPCFIDLFVDDDKTDSIIGLVIGVFLLLCCQDVLDFSLIWKLVVPIILIIVGLSIIFKDTVNNKIKGEIKKLNKNNDKEYSAIFGSQKINFAGDKFDGCSFTSIFGEIECDLGKAKLESDVVINTCSIFGGVTISVPDDVNVKVKALSIFGGVSDKRKNKNNDFKRTVYIDATCLFGGVSINE